MLSSCPTVEVHDDAQGQYLTATHHTPWPRGTALARSCMLHAAGWCVVVLGRSCADLSSQWGLLRDSHCRGSLASQICHSTTSVIAAVGMSVPEGHGETPHSSPNHESALLA